MIPTPRIDEPLSAWEILLGRRDRGRASWVPGGPTRDTFWEFVQAILDLHASGVPGVALHARVSTFSRHPDEETRWHLVGDVLDDATRTHVVESWYAAGSPREPREHLDERLCVIREVGGAALFGARSTFGQLIGMYPAGSLPAAIVTHLRNVSNDLLVGIKLSRGLHDAEALSSLTARLAQGGPRSDVLRQIGEMLRAQTSSDHASVQVVRWHGGRRQIQQVLRTDDAGAEGPPRPDRGEKALTDRVLGDRAWLLVPSLARGSDQPLRGLSEHGEVVIEENVTGSLDDDAGPAATRSVLMVPMVAADQVLGVLSVSRTRGGPYDPTLDRATLERFAHEILSVCRRWVEDESRHRCSVAVLELEKFVHRAPRPDELYREFNARAVTIAHAASGVLYLRDSDRSNVAYPVAKEFIESSEVGGSLIPVDDSNDSWEVSLAARLREAVEGTELSLREVILVPLVSAHSHASPPTKEGAALALFDKRTGDSPDTIDRGITEATLRSFLDQTGSVVLQRHTQALVQQAMDRAAEPWTEFRNDLPRTEADAQLVAAALKAVKFIYEKTTCDAVLIYHHESHRTSVVASWPECQAAKDREASDSTRAAIDLSCTLRHLEASIDLESGRDPIRAVDTGSLAQALGWQGIRSWLVVPLVLNGRPLGAVKLLTRGGGRYIDRASARIATSVVQRVATELLRWTRYRRLRELNDLATELATLDPARFGANVANKIEDWAGRFLSPNTHVFVLASVDGVRMKVYSACPHISANALKGENEEWLARLLDAWRLDPSTAPSEEGLALRILDGTSPLCFTHLERVPVPSHRDVAAWLAFVSERVFSREDLGAMREAAKELVVFLDHERQRHLWTLELARYRHAAIGPAQGLTSAARMLQHLALKAGADAQDVNRLGRMIEREATAIRLWRENQRIYASNDVKIVTRRADFKVLVDASCARFRDALQERGIALKLRWLCPHGFTFDFDADALDLVLSNLLDNARKYAFFNTEVTVEARLHDAHTVLLAIENIGHDIPERMRDEIYRVGRRLDWRDPIRSIDGTGLGLPMARALVERHGGTLTHECRSLGVSQGVARSAVRFVIILPRRSFA